MRRRCDLTSVRDALLALASDYSIAAAHQAEVAETGDTDAAQSAQAFSIVELVIRELAKVAATIEEAA